MHVDTHPQKFYRSRSDKIIGGVIGGLARYFNVDSMLLRVIAVALIPATGGFVVLLYILLWLLVPENPDEPESRNSSDRMNGHNSHDIHANSESRPLHEELERRNSSNVRGKDVLGIILVLVGVLVLANQLFPIYFSWMTWQLIWPALLVILGFFLLAKK